MKPKYPDDGGLKEPVRSFDEAFDGFKMIREHFGIQRIAPDPLSWDQFVITRVPYLFYRAANQRIVAGHVRLFASKPPGGWVIYQYNRQASCDEWALHRRWNFSLFCIHHVEPDKKATDPAGWSITWAKLKIKRTYRGITITWELADTFRCAKTPSKKKGWFR